LAFAIARFAMSLAAPSKSASIAPAVLLRDPVGNLGRRVGHRSRAQPQRLPEMPPHQFNRVDHVMLFNGVGRRVINDRQHAQQCAPRAQPSCRRNHASGRAVRRGRSGVLFHRGTRTNKLVRRTTTVTRAASTRCQFRALANSACARAAKRGRRIRGWRHRRSPWSLARASRHEKPPGRTLGRRDGVVDNAISVII